MKEVSYYPGCSLHGTAREYDDSIRGVSKLLEIQLYELEDWTCCGASSAHCTDEDLAIQLAARNLVIAEKSDRDLLVPCVACYSRFKAAEKETKEHPEKSHFPYHGNVPIRYALDFFCEEGILEAVKKKRTKPLSGLKVACYYGCLTVRPPKMTGIREYENPQHMDRLMKALGADPVPWCYKTDCCGASLVMTRTDIVRKLNDRLLSMAMEAEADCLVTGCPMCQATLDTRQEELKK
ncbi:MAG TPA: CoB--CoM heterodisulfide reductase iron-sulfur subunit B family protein, partial [Thermodesulfobacteriota bacterium]|nr:CoB--CoM heterodisulfide reductase iron-sulfur subunit B family protein [Thermodesulfobacteriota bacterium]